jgi:chemotaxis protein CheD
MDVIKVGMADLAVCKAPQKLMTAGLGSCVGVCIYDPRTKVGGLAHIMLPNSDQVKVVHNKAHFR